MMTRALLLACIAAHATGGVSSTLDERCGDAVVIPSWPDTTQLDLSTIPTILLTTTKTAGPEADGVAKSAEPRALSGHVHVVWSGRPIVENYVTAQLCEQAASPGTKQHGHTGE
jgi:hypothetical protein